MFVLRKADRYTATNFYRLQVIVEKSATLNDGVMFINNDSF